MTWIQDLPLPRWFVPYFVIPVLDAYCEPLIRTDKKKYLFFVKQTYLWLTNVIIKGWQCFTLIILCLYQYHTPVRLRWGLYQCSWWEGNIYVWLFLSPQDLSILPYRYETFYQRIRHWRSFSVWKETRRYSPLRRPTSSYCGGLRPRHFLPFEQKKALIMLFWPIFGNFWCPVVTLVAFSSNLRNFEMNLKKNKKIPQKIWKISKKKFKKSKNPKKSKKVQKIQIKSKKNPTNQIKFKIHKKTQK